MTRSSSPLISRRGVMLSAALVIGLSSSLPALADDAPAAVVNAFYAKLLETMKNGAALGFKGRAAALKPAFETAFNVPFMAQFVVGNGWAQVPNDQKTQLEAAFTDFSVAFYARNFKAFDGESFVIDGTREIPQGTMVTSRIVPKGDEPVPMNYLLRKGDKGWSIIDVFLNGTVSQLATRRTDFAKTLGSDGVPGLIQVLQTRAKELAEEG